MKTHDTSLSEQKDGDISIQTNQDDLRKAIYSNKKETVGSESAIESPTFKQTIARSPQ